MSEKFLISVATLLIIILFSVVVGALISLTVYNGDFL